MTYEESIPVILKHEGGFTIDTGGATMKGITQDVYDHYRVRKGLAKIPVKLIQDEEFAEIYKNQYWVEGSCDKIPKILRLTHFDFCVNAGIHRAKITLQKVADVTEDGIVGPKTIGALEKIPELELLDKYTNARISFYTKLAASKDIYARYLKSWIARTSDCKRRTLEATARDNRSNRDEGSVEENKG